MNWIIIIKCSPINSNYKFSFKYDKSKYTSIKEEGDKRYLNSGEIFLVEVFRGVGHGGADYFRVILLQKDKTRLLRLKILTNLWLKMNLLKLKSAEIPWENVYS